MEDLQNINKDDFGPVVIRAPYLEASLGRTVIGEQLSELTENISKFVTLFSLETIGVKYLDGMEIAPRTRFGILPSGTPRMKPDEVVSFAVSKMQETHSLADSSANPVTVRLHNLFLKRRRQKQKDIGFLLNAKIGDIPTSDYPVAGQLLAEKAVVMRKFGQKPLDLTLELEAIEHHIPLATGSMADFYNLKKQLKREPLLDELSVTLGPVGYLHTPRPIYP